jgi:hypothetical protein
MSVASNDYHGLWRASANEGVPYSEDFSEALLVLPEFIDGALGAGKASIIDIKFNITNPKECELIVNDNGKGLISEKRMKEWSSKDIGNNETENFYGHGSKKALTKFCPDYNNAKWILYWRKQDRRGLSGVLNILSSPFNGLETKHTEDDENEDICQTHGTCWKIVFDISVLGKNNKPNEIMMDIQEIIRARYESSYYHPYTINIQVTDGATILKKNSTEWKSLKESLEIELSSDKVKKTCEYIKKLDKTTVNFTLYEIVEDGRRYNITNMPTFGRKNMNSSRIHIARNGRYIEAMPYAKFMGKEYHNSDNGKIGFIIFTGEELPTPCTTKVKMQEECPIFKKMKTLIIKYMNKPVPKLVKPKPVDPKPVDPKPVDPNPVESKPEEKKTVKMKRGITHLKEKKFPSEPLEQDVPVQESKLKSVKELIPEPVPKPHPEPVQEAKTKFVQEPIQEAKTKLKSVKEPVRELIQEKQEVLVLLKDDTTILEKLYKKYGYDLLNEKLNELKNF